MFISERHEEIINLLNQDGKVKVKDLAVQFNVSEDLIRKDLKTLENQGICKKAYGGAILVSNKIEPLVSKRMDKFVEQKIEIAKKAIDLINEDETIFIDESTTNVQLAKLLANTTKRITVVTNMLDIIQILMNNSNITLICLGGVVSSRTNGFVGTQSLYLLEKYMFDSCFIGSAGIDYETLQLTTAGFDESLVKEKVIKNSKKKYLVMDDHKFESIGPCRFGKVEDFDYMIVNNNLTKEAKKILKKYKWKYI